jgi:HPt (histidine-containing phosphotransfer) domain-containing protein
MSQSEEEDFMAELKREFQETIKNNLRDFPKMMAEGRYEDIARIAHDIKGNAALFELARGSEIAARLQQAAQKRDEAQTASLIGELGACMKEAGIAD